MCNVLPNPASVVEDHTLDPVSGRVENHVETTVLSGAPDEGGDAEGRGFICVVIHQVENGQISKGQIGKWVRSAILLNVDFCDQKSDDFTRKGNSMLDNIRAIIKGFRPVNPSLCFSCRT